LKKIVTVIGARPQFIKAAPVSKALIEAGIEEVLVHSGQHYDANMSDIFWQELGIPEVKHHLQVGSGTHAQQTSQIMVKFEKILLDEESHVDAVLVYGDTNTTLGVALVASKLNISIIHVEAGLRSFNREMPEEINRILTDNISEYLFCSSEVSIAQLKKENIQGKAFKVGDVMYDAFLLFSEMSQDKPSNKISEDPFSIFTLHRQSNTKDANQVSRIIRQLEAVPHKVLWPIHPRIAQWKDDLEIPSNVELIEPIGYLEMLQALQECKFVFTDSGGLQKEAYWARKQCFTLRDDTEWVETLEGGWNTLVKLNSETIADKISNEPSTPWKPLYGDGQAAYKIAEILK
jgi:UDP-GlcNAc3NAcA epimerase